MQTLPFLCVVLFSDMLNSFWFVLFSDGQSSAIPVASMEFAAICLRNALLLLPEEQQDPKQENGSKSSNQLGGDTESSESSEACRYVEPWGPTHLGTIP